MTPFIKKNKMDCTSQPVPCGKCPACIKRRVSSWSFRLMQEFKVSTSSHFITLTYATEHVPITKNGFMQLSKRDLQLFFKRLRKSQSPGEKSIKYYACGEYGGRTNRPHYHVILFNADISKIQKAWNLGNVHYGIVTEAACGYTLKYISKKSKIPMHRNDDRQPEFPLMSKGMGLNYINEKTINWHLADLQNRMYLTIEDGKKVAMPRYYKQKIYSDEQRKAIAYQAKTNNEKEHDRGYAKDPENYYAKQASQVRGAFKKQINNSKNRDRL